MNKNLMLVAMLSMGTALTTLGKVKPVAASLTPPASYDYSYTWNATDSEQYLNVNGVDTIPLYTRTVDGVYYNYTNTSNVVEGLNVTHTFNRSNTTWQASGTSWKPDQDKIGSDALVGSISSKVYIKISNQTKNDYRAYIDLSSTGNVNALAYIEFETYRQLTYGLQTQLDSDANLMDFFIPSYVDFYLYYANTSIARYFDGWYLQDLGVSNSWQQGYDADTQGILTDYLGTDAQQIGWVLLGIAAILFVFKGGK